MLCLCSVHTLGMQIVCVHSTAVWNELGSRVKDIDRSKSQEAVLFHIKKKKFLHNWAGILIFFEVIFSSDQTCCCEVINVIKYPLVESSTEDHQFVTDTVLHHLTVRFLFRQLFNNCYNTKCIIYSIIFLPECIAILHFWGIMFNLIFFLIF